MIENPQISELQTNAIVAGASGHGSFAGGGKTSSWTSCAGFVLGAWTLNFLRVAIVTGKRASTRCFNVPPVPGPPTSRGTCAVPHWSAVPVSGASGNERFHDPQFDGMDGFL